MDFLLFSIQFLVISMDCVNNFYWFFNTVDDRNKSMESVHSGRRNHSAQGNTKWISQAASCYATECTHTMHKRACHKHLAQLSLALLSLASLSQGRRGRRGSPGSPGCWRVSSLRFCFVLLWFVNDCGAVEGSTRSILLILYWFYRGFVKMDLRVVGGFQVFDFYLFYYVF